MDTPPGHLGHTGQPAESEPNGFPRWRHRTVAQRYRVVAWQRVLYVPGQWILLARREHHRRDFLTLQPLPQLERATKPAGFHRIVRSVEEPLRHQSVVPGQ